MLSTGRPLRSVAGYGFVIERSHWVEAEHFYREVTSHIETTALRASFQEEKLKKEKMRALDNRGF